MHPRITSFLAFAALSLVATPAAHAVIVYSGNTATPAANLTTPVDNPGWGNVGTGINAGGGTVTGSVVYLGSYGGGYWVLSAAHVAVDQGVTSVGLAGNTYSMVAGSMVQLANPSNGSGTDLALFRINGDSALSGLLNLNISSTAPTAGSSLMYVGNGYGRAPSLSYWKSDWSLGNAGNGTYSGYTTNGVLTKSWGMNTVGSTVTGAVHGRTVPMFSSTLPASNGSAALFDGDSGGATFVKDAQGNWTLGGINEAKATYNGQPGDSSVVGDISYSTDLSVYYSQIQSNISV